MIEAMIEWIRYFASDSAAALFAVLFVGACYGIGRTIGNCAHNNHPRTPRRSGRRI